MLVKELVNTAVLVVPGVGIPEAVALGGIHHHIKLLIPGLNQLFDILGGILESDIVVNQSM